MCGCGPVFLGHHQAHNVSHVSGSPLGTLHILTLNFRNLYSVRSSVTSQLCNLGQVISLCLGSSFLICKMKRVGLVKGIKIIELGNTEP